MRRALLIVGTTLLALGVALAATPGAGTAHACAKDNELRFRAADGATLVGHRFGGMKPGKRTAVVLSHMSVGDLCQWAPYARRLTAKGFFVFPFDFRGHGSSPGRENHARAAADVVAAVRAVRGLGARKVVIGGASLGGIAVVIAAPKLGTAVQGVVAVSAPAAIAGELDALPAAPRLRVPTLYIAAEEDQNRTVRLRGRRADAARRHGHRRKASRDRSRRAARHLSRLLVGPRTRAHRAVRTGSRGDRPIVGIPRTGDDPSFEGLQSFGTRIASGTER